VPRFEKPAFIDDKLDDDVWKTAAVTGDFYQTFSQEWPHVLR
jgi:hypothetical protein